MRISVMTLNLWRKDGRPANWPQRRQPIGECLNTFTPDVLCVQELHPWTHELIRESLPTHRFVEDEYVGWECEGNIYWHHDMFDLIESGMVDIGMLESWRRLFWVRLRVKSIDRAGMTELLVATAHYTWEGKQQECIADANVRKQQAHRTVSALQELIVKINDPRLVVLFMGDLNENFHPRRIIREAGFIDCFAELRIPPPTTHPQRPSSPEEDILTDNTLDWIMQNKYARPLLANVLKNLRCTGGYSVSDHCPVMCIYEIGNGPYPSFVRPS